MKQQQSLPGDLGSALPLEEPSVEWTVGEEVNVAWTIQVQSVLKYRYRVSQNTGTECPKKSCKLWFTRSLLVKCWAVATVATDNWQLLG